MGQNGAAGDPPCDPYILALLYLPYYINPIILMHPNSHPNSHQIHAYLIPFY